MFLELPGRVAIVTGGARGIGFAIAERLSRAGARVVVADIDSDSAVAAVERLHEGGAEAVEAVADVTKPQEVGAMVERAIDAFGKLDVLVNDSATVLEDAAATSVSVLTNDTDIDGGPKTISSASEPANGTVVVTGGGSGLTYQPDPNYCNDPPATNLDTFTYTLNGGSLGTVSMKVTCVNDAPSAGNETFNGAIHNTSFVVDDPSDAAPNVSGAKKSITGDVLSNDSDVETPGSISVVANTNITTTNGGKVAIEADGDFTYISDPNDNCSPNSDSFNYTLTDNDPGGAQTTQGTVTINLSGCVWYVDNDPAETSNAGTSADPFDALSSADAKSVANQTVFVHKGTSTYTGGYSLVANERLIGEAVNLVVGADTLFTGTPANRPSLSGTVNLNSGNTISGVAIAGSGASAISGGSGDNSGTIANVTLSGGSGGLDLNTTSGTWNLSDLTVNTTGGDAIRAATAGTVNFTGAGTISVTAAAGRGLNLSGTATSGVIDSTTVTSSANEGIRIDDDTGSLTLDDVNLTTTGTGLDIDSSNDVTVNSSGDADISSTGRAVSLTTVTSNPANMPDVTLDQVSSTGGATGINIDDSGNGTFSANGGTLSGHTGAEVDVNNGSGNVTYPGTIGNGSGLSVQITGRSGGTIALSGNINDTSDAGGGIDMSSNSGGTATFSGATKTLNTGTSPAFSSTGSNPTITFSGGGLDIDTTSGAGFSATGGGTIVVGTGANPNTIDSTTGTALNVANTTIGASGLTFRSVSANGAATGIALNNTGSSGGLTVTGNGSAGTGGTITNITGADLATNNCGSLGSTTPAGVGIYLNNTKSPSFSWMNFPGTFGNFGILGYSVNGFTLDHATMTGTYGANVNQDEDTVHFCTLTGSASITNDTISNGAESNLRVVNASVSVLNRLTISNVTFGLNQTNGGGGVLLQAGMDPNSNTGTLNATVVDTTFQGSRGSPFQAVPQVGTSMDLVFGQPGHGNTVHNTHGNIVPFAQNLNVAAGGTLTFDINSNHFDSASAVQAQGGVFINAANSTANASGYFRNNTIGNSGVANSGSSGNDPALDVESNGGGDMTIVVDNNQMSQWGANGAGFLLQAGATSGNPTTFNATVTNNTIAQPGTFAVANQAQGFQLNNGTNSGENFTTCLRFAGNMVNGSGTGPGGDTRFRQRFDTKVQMPGYAGAADGGSGFSTLRTYIQGLNPTGPPSVTGVSSTANGGGFFNTPGGATCALPAF